MDLGYVWPPKATLTETGKQLDIWGNMHVVKKPAVVVMGDLNETLTRDNEAHELPHRAARGALVTQWFRDHDLSAPPQQSTLPSYYPYNQAHRPRRLDYIVTRSVRSTQEGAVHALRQVASSDHEGQIQSGIRCAQSNAGRTGNA